MTVSFKTIVEGRHCNRNDTTQGRYKIKSLFSLRRKNILVYHQLVLAETALRFLLALSQLSPASDPSMRLCFLHVIFL